MDQIRRHNKIRRHPQQHIAKINQRHGFTIVELLIVIVVIGVLAAITIVAYNGIQNRAKAAAAQSAVSQASKKIATYASINNDQYPIDLTAAGVTNSGDTTFQYSVSNATTPKTYCVTATVGNANYYVSNGGSATQGVCAGQNSVALSCPTGYIQVPGNSAFSTTDFCTMKYEAKNVSSTATSQASGSPWVSISQANAISTSNAACSGCHLMSENEWMTIAASVLSVDSNWSGGVVGSGYIYSGHNDTSPNNAIAASGTDSDGYNGTGNTSGQVTLTSGMTGDSQRRTLTLSNGEVIWDFAGNVWEWTTGSVNSGQQPGISGESSYVWKQWNNGSLVWNGFLATSRPSALTSLPRLSDAATWSSTQGIGQLNSRYADTSTPVRVSFRSGSWNSTTNAGVLTLSLSYAPNDLSTGIGFRVSK